MKKRLRKKLHLGEFSVHGVSLKVSFVANLTKEAFGVFVDEFVEEAMESNGLLFGGGGSCASGWNGVIEPVSGERTISGPLFDAVSEWLAVRAEVSDFQISEPWDIWRGKNPFDLPSATRHAVHDPLFMHPELSGRILYDPTEPADENEWPEERR